MADPATDQLPSEVTEGADPLDALQLGQLPKPNVLFLLQSPVPSADCLLKHLLVLEVSKVVLVLVGSTGSRPDEVLELLKKMHLPAPTPSTGKKSSPSISLEQVDLGRHFQPPIHPAGCFSSNHGHRSTISHWFCHVPGRLSSQGKSDGQDETSESASFSGP